MLTTANLIFGVLICDHDEVEWSPPGVGENGGDHLGQHPQDGWSIIAFISKP
jgi:hypothetical protein